MSAALDIAPGLAVLDRRSRAWDPLADLFPAQRAFVLDPAKRKTARTTRRAGKTKGDAHYLLKEGSTGVDASCLYIHQTRLLAKRQVWEECLRLIGDHHLPARVNHSELTIRFGNRQPIMFTGADNAAEIEKARGFKLKLALVDEAQSFAQYIRKLVDEVLSPALMDVDGTLGLTGTPGPLLQGLFYEATTTAKGWSRHRWSVLDNPHVAGGNPAAWIDAEKERRGWTEQTPGFLREYRGEWVRSDDELVYHYDPRFNDYEELPSNHDWRHILSLDVGYRDRTAFSVGAYCDDDPAYYGVHEEAHSGMIPSAIAERIKDLREQYQPHTIVMDCGALGLSMAEEFRQKHSLPIQAAEKREKGAVIEFLNGDLRRGLVKVRSHSPLVDEWRTLQYDPKIRAADPRTQREDPRLKNDLADAFLYGYRHARHYLAELREAVTDADRKRRQVEHQVEESIRRRHEPQTDTEDFADWGM